MAQELPLALEELDVPLSCVRALESTYATQARADFERYVRRTLHFSQRLGGRFSPPLRVRRALHRERRIDGIRRTARTLPTRGHTGAAARDGHATDRG